MRLFFIIFVLSINIFAVSKATKPYTHTNPAKISELNKNLDSIYVPFNKGVDTLNKGIPRWSQVLHNHDSTYTYIKGDTIVDLDTIYSGVGKFKTASIDTLKNVKYLKDSLLIIYSGLDSNFFYFRNASYPTHGASQFASYYGSATNYGLSIGMAGSPTLGRAFNFNCYNGTLTNTGMIAATNLLTNYIQFGTTASSKCSTYIDTVCKDTLVSTGGIDTFKVADSCRIIQIGNTISFYQFNEMTEVVQGVPYLKIPTKFIPTQGYSSAPALNNGTNPIAGRFHFMGSRIRIDDGGGNYLNGGYNNISIYSQYVQWIK
jgi:hypothetical protein